MHLYGPPCQCRPMYKICDVDDGMSVLFGTATLSAAVTYINLRLSGQINQKQ